MIAVTGANGQLGRLVIEALLKRVASSEVIALVRNPDKAGELAALGVEVRKADYSQPDTLQSALGGVDKLLLISGTEFGRRVAQHSAVIDAAKNAGVQLLAYTSILHADSSPLLLAEEHKATELVIADSGLPAVVLRNGWYSENYTDSVPGVVHSGVVAGAAKNGKLHTAARKDYAEAAAAVLLAEESQAGKVYELAGDQGFLLADYAALLSQLTGQEINYAEMDQAGFQGLLLEIGLPEGLAIALADTEVHAANGWLADNSNTLSTLIGRPTTPIADTVKAALAALV